MRSRRAGSVQKQLMAPGSILHRYRDTVLGDKGWLVLALYELNELFFSPLPGVVGRSLRSCTAPLLLRKIGAKVGLGTNVAMRRPGQICLGSHVTIGSDVSMNVKDDGRAIVLADRVEIGRETILSCIGGELKLGYNTKVGRRCRLGSKMGLEIGESCLIGDNTYIVGASHKHDQLDVPIIDQEITCKGPSCIGDNVEIGENVTILDGVQIGNNARVVQGSLVNQNIDAGVQVAGVPAIPTGNTRK